MADFDRKIYKTISGVAQPSNLPSPTPEPPRLRTTPTPAPEATPPTSPRVYDEAVVNPSVAPSPPIPTFSTFTPGGGSFRPRATPQTVTSSAASPTPTPTPSIFSTNPALANEFQRHDATVQQGGEEGYGTRNPLHDILADHFNPSSRTASQNNFIRPEAGQTLGEMLKNAPQGYQLNRAEGGGYVYAPFSTPTTEQAQEKILSDSSVRGGGGGIIPPWNSPTGQAIDARATGPQVVDTSFAGPTPPSGWVQAALKAARAGEASYATGAPARTTPEGNYPNAAITQSPATLSPPFAGGKTTIASPSGGNILLPNNETATGQTETVRRANLYDAIQKSQNSRNYGTPLGTSQLQAKSDEAEGRAYQQRAAGGAYPY